MIYKVIDTIMGTACLREFDERSVCAARSCYGIIVVPYFGEDKIEKKASIFDGGYQFILKFD